jgi:hypothetical protein
MVFENESEKKCVKHEVGGGVNENRKVEKDTSKM